MGKRGPKPKPPGPATCCRCGETDKARFAPSQLKKRTGKWCRACQQAYYKADGPDGFNRQSAYQRTGRHKKRDALEAYKVERGCADCGIKHPAVLSFDHDGDKSFTISQARLRMAMHKLLAEAAKCTVRCENCHRIRHWNLRQTEQ